MNADEITIIASFVAGFASFLSPCVLPLAPAYISMLTVSEEEQGQHWRLIINTACFMAGFTLVFLAMGATASLIGQLFLEYQSVIRKISAIIIIIMGLQLLGLLKFSRLANNWQPLQGTASQGPFASFILGITVTTGWTPCAGPILASVLAYAGITGTVAQGLALLLAYSAGFATPFLAVALLMKHYQSRIASWHHLLPVFQRVSGTLLILTGILLYYNLIQRGIGIIYQLFD